MPSRTSSSGSRTCPACGGTLRSWRSATSADHALLPPGQGFELRRCPDCGTAVTAGAALASGAATEQIGLYEGGYYSRPARFVDRLIEPLRRVADRGRLKRLGSPGEHSRVLEYGAGDGRLLEVLSRRGAMVVGVEPSISARGRAAERGIDLFEDLEDPSIAENSFDLIICWHVLEHLENPRAELSRLATLLAPDGTLVLSVPNLASLQARIGGDRWFGQDVPRHLTHFTPDGIRRIANRSDLEVEGMHFWSMEQNPFGMWQTLVSRASGSRDAIFRLVKRQPLGDTARGRAASVFGLLLALPLIVIAVPLEWTASAVGKGGTVTASLRSPSAEGAGQ